MTIPEILKQLEPYTGRLPTEALRSAIEQRESITPELLRILEAVAENPSKFQESTSPFFSVFLLAQFREPRAYRPIVKMVGLPGETPFDLLGDTITEYLQRIFFSVYDGDPTPLQTLAEGEAVNEFVRFEAIRTFNLLAATNQMPQEEVAAYYRSLFHGRLQRTPSLAWTALVVAVAELPAPELREEMRQAFADGLADDSFATLAQLERHLLAPKRRRERDASPIGDVISVLQGWAAYQPEENRPKVPPPPPSPAPAVQPWLAPSPPPAPKREYQHPPPRVKIGRNDSCPCGSGKKYKKCCGKN